MTFVPRCNFLCFQVDPYLPFEYTHEGMLERVNALVENQVRNGNSNFVCACDGVFTIFTKDGLAP